MEIFRRSAVHGCRSDTDFSLKRANKANTIFPLHIFIISLHIDPSSLPQAQSEPTILSSSVAGSVVSYYCRSVGAVLSSSTHRIDTNRHVKDGLERFPPASQDFDADG